MPTDHSHPKEQIPQMHQDARFQFIADFSARLSSFQRIIRQLQNIFEDLVRHLIVETFDDALSFIPRLDLILAAITHNPQKLSAFKISDSLLDELDEFHDFFISQFRKYAENIQGQSSFQQKLQTQILFRDCALIIKNLNQRSPRQSQRRPPRRSRY